MFKSRIKLTEHCLSESPDNRKPTTHLLKIPNILCPDALETRTVVLNGGTANPESPYPKTPHASPPSVKPLIQSRTQKILNTNAGLYRKFFFLTKDFSYITIKPIMIFGSVNMN